MVVSLVSIAKKSISLTERQLRIIESFERFYTEFLKYKKEAQGLMEISDANIRNPSQENYILLQEKKGSLERRIIASLRILQGEEEFKDAYKEWQEKRLKVMQILESDIHELRDNITSLPETEVKRTLLLQLANLQQIKEESVKEEFLGKTIESFLKGLMQIVEEEEKQFEAQLSILQQNFSFALKDFNEVRKVELKEGMSNIIALVNELERELEEERKKYILPYKIFVNQNFLVEQKIIERAEQSKKISIAMIKEDLRLLTPQQAEKYMDNILQHFAQFEEDIVPYYLRFKKFFKRKQKKEEFEQEDILRKEIGSLEKTAYYDPTLGIPTKNVYLEKIDTRIREMTRKGGMISLAMIDVDRFKSINDTFGHPVGDEVLWEIAQKAKESLRGSDEICRYGGEEIVVLFSKETDYKQAMLVAERIRAYVE